MQGAGQGQGVFWLGHGIPARAQQQQPSVPREYSSRSPQQQVQQDVIQGSLSRLTSSQLVELQNRIVAQQQLLQRQLSEQNTRDRLSPHLNPAAPVQVAPAEQYMPQPESGNGLALNYEMQVAVRDRAVLIPISHYQHVLQKGDDAAKEVELKKVIDQMQIVSNDNADLNGIFIQYIDHLYKRELPLKNYTQDELIAVLHYALSNEHLTQETIDAKRVAAALSEFGALGEGTVNKFVANDAKLRRHIMNGYCAWLRLTLLKHVTNDPKASHLDAFGHVDKERTNAILEWCKKTVTPPVTRTSEIQWDIADIKSVEQTGSKGTESKQEGDEEDIDQFLA